MGGLSLFQQGCICCIRWTAGYVWSLSPVVKLLEPELAPILNGAVSSDEAIEASRQQLQQDNPNPRWCIPWSYVLWQQGDYNGAYAVAARYHTLLQEDGDFLLLFGMIVGSCQTAAIKPKQHSRRRYVCSRNVMMLTIILQSIFR